MACNPSFANKISSCGVDLKRSKITVLQVNMGKLCNQACSHCHVEAGPKRTEIMQLRTVDRLFELLDASGPVDLVDITGGAPEMNPHFRYFVEGLIKRSIEVIDRCNLTVLHEKGQEDTAKFLAENKVQVTASLPCYSSANVDQQRGKGVFAKSIESLQMLGELGYGGKDTGLVLNLVYNPLGDSLPPPQGKLQADYKKRLYEDFAIKFNNLFVITNMPIKRFAHFLNREGKLDAYMKLLVDNFNKDAAGAVMCKDLISIGWDGDIYDCDFNQMLEIPVAGRRTNIWDIANFAEISENIALADHCYGCTAGSGSSCGGALV